MEEVLKNLIELQKYDLELLKLESLRGDLPNQVSRLNEEIESVERLLEENENKLQAYKKEHGIIEMEIKALEGKQKKYQSQLFQVKTNREYDAVTLEIEAVKQNIEKKESNLLEIMDLEDETKSSLKVAKEESEKLREQFIEKKSELEARIKKTEKDEAFLKDKRGKVVKKIEPRILATYERIRKAKNGFAVVPVIRGACGGCFKTLPPQRILEIREMNRIHLCEVCGRILVWDEKAVEQSS